MDNALPRCKFSSVAQSCLTLCNPMDCSTPGFPVHHQLWELTQTHACWVGDGIQPSHALSSPSPPTFSLSQNQGLFKWVSSSHQVAKVLKFQLPPWVLPMNIQDWFPLELTGWTQRFISIVIMLKSRNFSCASGNAGMEVDFQLRFFIDLKVHVPKFKVSCPPHTKIKRLV